MADDDDDVGYKKPPKKNRFKKGQSGNPSGRSRKKAAPVSVIDKVLKSKLDVLVDGKAKRVTVVEAALMKLAKQALEGDPQAIRELMRLELTRAKERPDEDQTTFHLTIGEIADAPLNAALRALGITSEGENKQRHIERWVVEAAMARLPEQLSPIDVTWVRKALGKNAWF